MTINAGALDRRVVIEQLTVTRDAAGGELRSYSTRATVWGAVRFLTGREVLAAAQPVATEQAEVLIRYRSDVLPTDRVRFNGKTWGIDYLAEVGTRVGLRLVVTRPEEVPT